MTNKKPAQRKTTMRTEVLSEMVTNHARKIAAIGPDEKFTVKYVLGNEDITTVDGEIEDA